MMAQRRSQPLAVAADTQVPGVTSWGKYVSALVTPAAADATLTIYDGAAAGNKIVAQIKAVANGPTVGEQLTHPIAFTNGLHYTLTGAGAICQIGVHD